MKVCPHCNMDLPDDSIYCTYCGKPIEKVKETRNETINNTQGEEQEQTPKLKTNPRTNPFGKLGVFLFLVGLFGCDFILATVVNAITGNANFVFIISAVIYALSIVSGVLCLYVDHTDKKKGYEPNGGIQFAMLSIIMSAFTIILNVNTIFLR